MNKVNNKTFDNVDYSNITELDKIKSERSEENFDIEISHFQNNTIMEAANDISDDEIRIAFFYYHIYPNIDKIIESSPEQVKIMKCNPLYLKIYDFSNDNKIAISTTLAFILNLYYFIKK